MKVHTTLLIGASLAAACAWSGDFAANAPAKPQVVLSAPPSAGAEAGAGKDTNPSGYVGSEVCASCHEDQANALKKTIHGRTTDTTWEGVAGCESCHGPGAAHVESPGEPGKIRVFGKISASDTDQACLSCHERGVHSNWQGSPHEGRGLSCLTCHKIHQTGEPHPSLLVKDSEFTTCGSCHLKRKASLMRSAHMPLREGTMTCSSCHNPHGSTGPAMLKQDSVNENCYSCHAERRSPNLWEHPPVRENCLTCHDPHGSLHPRMLIAKTPRLCQQCHDETRHPTQPYSDASAAPEFFPNSRMFDRGCLNCHSQIHGSNHPAGIRFLR